MQTDSSSNRDIEIAKQLLGEGNNTCVLVLGESRLTSTRKGISPMLDFIASGRDLKGYSVADKIVGKAAALLFVYAGLKEVYAEILSKNALAVFDSHGVRYSYSTLVDHIINRSGTGNCPMEEAVKKIDCPVEAHAALVRKLAQLMSIHAGT